MKINRFLLKWKKYWKGILPNCRTQNGFKTACFVRF